MRCRDCFWAMLMTWCCAVRLHADEAKKQDPAPTAKDVDQAVTRGLDFLVKDALTWRKEKTCSTCHHGAMTVWALAEAKSRGRAVAADTFADMLQWTKDRLFKNIDKPRDTRPGWKMVNSSAAYLSVLALNMPKQNAISADEMKQIAGHLLRHQEEDGSWAWSSAPAKNRPPPFFESDEVVTLLASMALKPHESADAKAGIRESRDKAAAWLAKNKPNDTTQAAGLRLLFKLRAGESPKALAAEIAQFLELQRTDGGWGQLAERPSDAYATGQALYLLNVAGVKSDRAEIRRGVAFLVAGQKEDGSWPMTRRGHPGVTPGDYIVPITYFGSAWATVGLMRSAP